MRKREKERRKRHESMAPPIQGLGQFGLKCSRLWSDCSLCVLVVTVDDLVARTAVRKMSLLAR